LDTDLLKTFLEVSRTRHFGRAADNLYVTQSAVSARIRQLEESLGVRLFTRERNNIQLTAAGQRLLRHAESITTTWNRARQELALGDDGPELLSVGAMANLWDILLQDWLDWVYRELSEIRLATEVHRVDTLSRKLLEGSLDLGFVFDAPQLPELHVVSVARVPLLLVSSQAGQTAGEALAGGYVLVDWGTAFSISHARHFPDALSPRLRVELGRMAHGFLLANGGAAYLAEPMVRADLAQGRLFRVEDAPIIERDVHAIFSRGSARRSGIEQTLDYFDRPSAE
jgi:DNA-binding transcriptional LysR family regulator